MPPNAIKERLRSFSMFFALLVIWAVFNYLTDNAFLQPRNISNLFRQIAITGILSTGMVLIIVAGHVDLSVGSVVAFLGAFLSILITNHSWSPSMAALFTILLGMIIGAFHGFLISYQKIPAFIVTLGGMMVFRGLAMGISDGSTIPLGENWLQTMAAAYLSPNLGYFLSAVAIVVLILLTLQAQRSKKKYEIAASSAKTFAKLAALSLIIFIFTLYMNLYQGIPLPVLLMLALIILFFIISMHTPFGRYIYAVGGNAEAAYLSGVNVNRVSFLVFLLMGMLTGIGAIVLTARVGSASPDAGQLLELDAIAACVIGGTSLMGGRGSVFGAILGATVMESLNNGMSLANMNAYWQYIIKGIVLIAAVWVDRLSQGEAK